MFVNRLFITGRLSVFRRCRAAVDRGCRDDCETSFPNFHPRRRNPSSLSLSLSLSLSRSLSPFLFHYHERSYVKQRTT